MRQLLCATCLGLLGTTGVASVAKADDRNILVLPVKTDLQRTAMGIDKNTVACVLVNSDGLRREDNALHWTSLDLAGRVFLDNPVIGRIATTNLTSGKGGVGNELSDADWVRAIRHGVRPDGKPLLIMPAGEFYYLSDADLGAVIAYLKSLPPVDNELPANKIGPLFRVAMTFMDVVVLPAEVIDHTAPRPISPEVGVTVEYGKYLAITCTSCHGPSAPPNKGLEERV